MKPSFGPWTTAINTGNNPQLSPFWKRRLGMLTQIARNNSRFTRNDYLALFVLALLVLVCPTFREASVKGEQEQFPATEKKLTGRIFVNMTLRTAENLSENMIVAIDPQTGTWQKMTDAGNSVRISPDGQTIAFSKEDAIWNCDTAGGNNPGKISDIGNVVPVWSANGKHLVATISKEQTDEKNKEWNSVRLRYDGIGAPETLEIPKNTFVWDWSADGEWLAAILTSRRDDNHQLSRQIVIMRPDGKGQRQITTQNDNLHPRFSPDGRRVSYRTIENRTRSIRVTDIEKNEETILFQADGFIAPQAACWSPDGKHLAVIVFDWKRDAKGNTIFDHNGNDNFRFVIFDADGKKHRDLNLKLDQAKIEFIGHPDWR